MINLIELLKSTFKKNSNVLLKIGQFFKDIYNKNDKISYRIKFSLLSIILVFIIVLLINIFLITRVPATKDSLVNLYEKVNQLNSMNTFFSTEKNIHNSVLSVGKSQNSSSLYIQPSSSLNKLVNSFKRDKLNLSKEDILKLDDIVKIHNDFSNLFFNNTLKIGKDIENGLGADINVGQNRVDTFKKIDTLSAKFEADVDFLLKSLNKKIDSKNGTINGQLSFIIIIFLIGILISIVLALYFSLTLSKSISTSINNLISKMDNVINNKDLSQLIEIKGNDEITDLCSEFNKMINWQMDVISKFSNAANIVGEKSRDIDNTSEELSSLTKQQSNIVVSFTKNIEQMDSGTQDITVKMSSLASNVNSVSSAIQEMGNSIQETAGNIESTSLSIDGVYKSVTQMGSSIDTISKHASNVKLEAENAIEKAKEGNIVVKNTIEEMEKVTISSTKLSTVIKELGGSAEKIEEIISVIDEVAEQTNLLSLNAAIEAARAGDAGKGFAVVASSIRILAEKSGTATKDITGIIKGIQNEVKNAVLITKESAELVNKGSKNVKHSGMVFEDIYKAVNNTGKLVQNIAASIEEQDIASKEIIKTIKNMSQLVSSLSATTQEQAAGSDEIIKSVENINSLMKEMTSTAMKQSASSQEVLNLIIGINNGISEVSHGSENIAVSGNELDMQAQELIQIINQFKIRH